MKQILNDNDARERLDKAESMQRVLVEYMNECVRCGHMGKRKEFMLKLFDLDAEELIYKKYLHIIEQKVTINDQCLMPVECGKFTEAQIIRIFKLTEDSYIEYQ